MKVPGSCYWIFLPNCYNSRDKNFGNARTVKNILYKAISNQEERVLTLYNLKDEDLSTITFDDVNQIDVNEIITYL